eukprot:16434094-Heterocapsa_arctica.AAC.1
MLQALDRDNVAVIARVFTGRARGYLSAPHDWHSTASTCFPKVESLLAQQTCGLLLSFRS